MPDSTSFDPTKPVPDAGPFAHSTTSLKRDATVKVLDSTAEVVGQSDLKNGVYGGSKKQTGVVGHSDTFMGVAGDGPFIGVNGFSENGDGVVGTGRRGVVGQSFSFQGVFGKSTQNAGVVGESDLLHGVFGVGHNPNGGGVFGSNDRGGVGVIGVSDAGIGVSGKGGFLAGRFEGDVEVTGDIRLGNADCAEDFDVDTGEPADPGTVMVVGELGKVRRSDRPYDKRAVGVVSGAGSYKPGIVLDKRPSDQDRRPLALLGKVFCFVDASYGAIEVGDLLTTSATAGHAMKASDSARAFGAVIGKALAPLAAGQGLVPILVALQ